MILWIGFITLIIGQIIEKKTNWLSKILKTERGQFFLGNNLALFISGALTLLGTAFMMAVLNIDQNVIVPVCGIILGHMMLVITVTYDMSN